MRTLLIIIPTILFYDISGQQVFFEGLPVDSVLINSNLSAYQFDDEGTTNGKAGLLSIVFDTLNSRYFIKQFSHDTYKRTLRPDTIEIETELAKYNVPKPIDSQLLETLLNALSGSPVDSRNISQFDTSCFKTLLTENRIRMLAKHLDAAWQFKKKYSTKEENRAFFDGCMSLDTVRVYLKERFNQSGYPVVTDYSRRIKITVSAKNSTFYYEGKYPNPVFQPWYYHGDIDQSIAEPIFNLQINSSLFDVLPDGFILKDSVSLEAIVDDYVMWYLEKHDMLN